MEAGSITFSTALDNKQLEKDLSSLTKKIEKKERDIAELTAKRDEAKGKGVFDAAALDAEKAKLQEIKDRLADIRARAKDKTLSLEDREAARELIPSVKQEYDDQKTHVQGLQTEWNKTEAAVERYNAQLSEAENDLARMKEEAGHITQQLDEAKTAAGGMGGHLERAEGKLSSILEKLQQQQSVAVEVNKALGDVVDTQTRLTGLAEEFSLGAKIGLVGLAKAAVHVAGLIAKGVPGALKSAASAVSGFAKSAITKIPSLMRNAFSGAAKLAGAFGKKLIGVLKNMNVFSKLSDGLSQKFKRLGSTIKQALVFSMIYKGLATVREQMGAYLAVNTQFSTALRQLQGVLLTAFQPIYDTVLPALTALANGLSRAIAVVSQFTARLFGTTAKQAQKSAEELYNEANALKATGEAAEEAAGSLAGFDEINTIQTEKQGGGGGGASADTGPLFDYEYEDQPFDSWGEAFSGFLDKMLNGIPVLRESLSDFADWLNGFTKKLYDMFTFPGVLEKVQQLGRDLANALNEMVSNINWYQLGQALGAGLNLALQFLVNFIYTFDWISLGQSLASMINGAVSEIDWYAVGQLLWAGFKIAIETLAGFLLGLDMAQLAEAASNLAIGFFDSITETLGKIDWKQIGVQVATFLKNVDWAGVAEACFKAIGAAFGAAAAFLWGLIQDAWDDVIDWWHEAAYEDGEFTITGLLEGILKVVGDIAGWAIEHIVDPFFEGLDEIFPGISEWWEDIKKWWGSSDGPKKFLTLEYWKGKGKEILDGLLGGLRDAWESIKTWVNEKVQWIADKFSNASRAASGAFGTTTSGFRMAARALPSIAPVSIPALAQGAVIPPNREFMAVLGDQRSGYNIEAPADLIRQMVIEGIQAAGVSGGNNQPIQVNVMLDKRVLARAMVNEVNDMTRQAGRSVIDF